MCEKGVDGKRRFLFNEHTKLLPVEPSVADAIRREWTAWGYGATLQKIGCLDEFSLFA